jgi:hypothetical protein
MNKVLVSLLLTLGLTGVAQAAGDAEAGQIDTPFHTNRAILMPAERPVRAIRLVKSDHANGAACRPEKPCRDFSYRTGATKDAFQSRQRADPPPGRWAMRESVSERVEKASYCAAMKRRSITVELELA